MPHHITGKATRAEVMALRERDAADALTTQPTKTQMHFTGPVTGNNYIRDDGVLMVEVAPHQFVNQKYAPRIKAANDNSVQGQALAA